MKVKLLFLLCCGLLLGACSNDSSADIVKDNAERAMKQCGKGNVKEVTITGFSCFERNQHVRKKD